MEERDEKVVAIPRQLGLFDRATAADVRLLVRDRKQVSSERLAALRRFMDRYVTNAEEREQIEVHLDGLSD